MPPTYKQLELDLWGGLKVALKSPEAADMQLLWQGLEDAIPLCRLRFAIAPLERNGQLQVAGDAIAQIVEIHVSRANAILDSLEVTDSQEGPVLDEDFLSGLMRQSMSMDLSDLMEEFAFDLEVNPVSVGSVRAIARQEQARMTKALKDLWLGLLLGKQEQYQWETSGEFYHDAGKLWLRTVRSWSD